MDSSNVLTDTKVSDGTTLAITGFTEIGVYQITGTNEGGSDIAKAGITYSPQ